MKQILYFFVLFLSVPCFAQEVQTVYNAPNSEFLIVDDKIYVPVNSSSDKFFCSIHCETLEQAQQVASLWPQWCSCVADFWGCSPSFVDDYGSQDSYFNPPAKSSCVIAPVRSGTDTILGYDVIYLETNGEPVFNSNWTSFLNYPISLGENYGFVDGYSFLSFVKPKVSRSLTEKSVNYSYYGEAVYTQAPDPTPDVPADGGPYVITFIDGVQYYVLPESSYPTDDYSVIVNGPSLWASSLASAQTCADNFADFLESYSWPFWGVPDIMPYSEPKIYKCQTFFNGEAAGTFYRIVFQDYTNSAALAYDGHYQQCLNDYSQGAGGTGGYNTMSIVKPCATYTDTVNVSSELAGVTLASTSNSDTGQLTQITDDVAVTQYTAAKVNAEEGDYTGTSTVSSTASASEDGTTVNITNNTTVETNLELGDAPDADSYSNSEDGGEKEAQESGSLLTQQETVYTYIDDSSTEKKIDWEKFWGDFKEKIGEMIGYDKIEAFFGQEIDSQPLTDWSVNVMGASFVIPWSILLSSQPIAIARSALSAFCMLGTFFACFRMLA